MQTVIASDRRRINAPDQVAMVHPLPRRRKAHRSGGSDFNRQAGEHVSFFVAH